MKHLLSAMQLIAQASKEISISAFAKYEASPLKLRDGSWGARVQGTPRSGDTIRVTTRGGKSWESVVDKVIWTDRKVSIVSVESRKRSSSSRSSRPPARRSYGGWGDMADSGSGGSGVCDECHMRHSNLRPCQDSSGLGGQCCPHCARMSRWERSFA